MCMASHTEEQQLISGEECPLVSWIGRLARSGNPPMSRRIRTSTTYIMQLCSHADPRTDSPSKSRLAQLAIGYNAYDDHTTLTL